MASRCVGTVSVWTAASVINSTFIHICVTAHRRDSIKTRNSVDEIGERYRLNHAIIVKLYYPYTQFPRSLTFAYLIGESLLFRRIGGAYIVTFLIIAPCKYSYLLTDQFLPTPDIGRNRDF